MCNDNFIMSKIDRLTQDQKNEMLFAGCKQGMPFLVDLALAIGADVNCKGNSPLVEAVLSNDFETVETLIKAGANLRDKPLVIHFAVTQGNYNMAKFLILSGAPMFIDGVEIIKAAIYKEDINFLKFICNQNIKITKKLKNKIVNNVDNQVIIEIIESLEEIDEKENQNFYNRFFEVD